MEHFWSSQVFRNENKVCICACAYPSALFVRNGNMHKKVTIRNVLPVEGLHTDVSVSGLKAFHRNRVLSDEIIPNTIVVQYRKMNQTKLWKNQLELEGFVEDRVKTWKDLFRFRYDGNA